MIEFKVERGVPMPDSSGRGKPRKYPWKEMEVGDSFVAPAQQGGVFKAASSATRHTGMSFCYRNIGNGKVRVWRVK